MCALALAKKTEKHALYYIEFLISIYLFVTNAHVFNLFAHGSQFSLAAAANEISDR